MSAWRLAALGLSAVLLGPPLLAPFLLAAASPTAWQLDAEWGRRIALLLNTLLLVSGVVALTLPLAVALGFLLERTDIPLRRPARSILLLLLFLPLPLLAAGWQAVVPSLSSAIGLGPAIALHALAALPWATLIVGIGMRSVEPELEDDARTLHGLPWVIWHVTLARSLPAVGAVALWIGLQTAGEITFTDLFQVRTYAEEVYTQLVAPEPEAWRTGDALAQAASTALLPALGLALLVFFVARQWDRRLTERGSSAPALLFQLGFWRVPLTLLVVGFVALLTLPPLGGLLWRVGASGVGSTWHLASLAETLGNVMRTDASLLFRSLVLAFVSGLLLASLALLLCWTARESPTLAALALAVLALAWALPGPVVGLGLKQVIDWLLAATGADWLARWLYFGPSPAPLLWINLVRFLPAAAALLWPAVRAVPRELVEAARIDGLGPLGEFRHVFWPACRPAWELAVLVLGVLSLGELSAGKLVSTPGWPSYAEVLFQRLHYGITPDLAGGCLLLLALIAVLVALLVRAADDSR